MAAPASDLLVARLIDWGVVDPLEPPMPPMVTRAQAVKFAESLLKGQPDRLKIAVTAGKEYVRQLI
jgi:pyruvate dehydrogenase (quinone)